MSIQGVAVALTAYESSKTGKSAQKTAESQVSSGTSRTERTSAETKEETQSAVYEKSSEENNKVYKQDTATMARLKADAEKRNQQLRSLVAKMFGQQVQTYSDADFYQLLRTGNLPVDSETSAQAQKDISEDGYWGITQTSDRLVSFAKALSGGDPDKADELMEAVKKGFKQATKAWGGELPDICGQTLDETIRKLEEWKKSTASEGPV